ncbi:F-box/LRR-repeat protein At3g03360 [Linum grandiflorum]
MASDSVCTPQQVSNVKIFKLFDEVCNLDEELDWISQLPDELLVIILSRLNLREAFRTSVLSSRWIDLWKSAVSVLEFDASEELAAISRMTSRQLRRTLPRKRLWYKNWVNRVISQVQQSSSRLTKFRVSFNLTNECNSEGDIDRWLEFAISKRVESLHLTLNAERTLDSRTNYVFSEECCNHIKTPAGLDDIRFLRSLRLTYVNVKGEILEHVIANCPVLEELAVKSSLVLRKLKVVGSSSLKHFEVRGCRFLVSLEIDHVPRLGRLICAGAGAGDNQLKEIKVGGCPSLVDVSLGEGFVCSQTFTALSGCASQLVSLFLNNDFLEQISDAAEHSNLERLTVRVQGPDCGSILSLVPLINACPRLHTLQLFFQTFQTEVTSRRSVDVVKVGRNSIKVVEVVGFRGYAVEYEFMEYVMEYFVGLERIVIDWSTTSFISEDTSIRHMIRIMSFRSEKQRHEAEKLVLELKSRAPPTAEFHVI